MGVAELSIISITKAPLQGTISTRLRESLPMTHFFELLLYALQVALHEPDKIPIKKELVLYLKGDAFSTLPTHHYFSRSQQSEGCV
jgi:hypothetical protein